MPVNLDVSEVKRVVEKTNGCLVWGGAVHLAPADDIFIKTEYQFSICGWGGCRSKGSPCSHNQQRQSYGLGRKSYQHSGDFA